MYVYPGAHIEFGGGTHLGPGFGLIILAGGTFITGKRVEFRRGFRAEIAGDVRTVIGSDSVFTYDVIMQRSTSIEIGERCVLGQSVDVFEGQSRLHGLGSSMLGQGHALDSVTIANDVSVGSKATVMASLGERAGVAAYAVVTRPVPSYSGVAGVPARVTEYFGPPGGEPAGLVAKGASS